MILDTGLLIAAAIRSDRHHDEAKGILALPERKHIPEPVVAETCYMMASRLGPQVELAFVRSLLSRTFDVESIARKDRARIVDLLERYADLPLGYVDASIVAIAERLQDGTVATLDRKDFSVVRPLHTETFHLVP